MDLTIAAIDAALKQEGAQASVACANGVYILTIRSCSAPPVKIIDTFIGDSLEECFDEYARLYPDHFE